MKTFTAVLLVALASNAYAQAGGSTQPSGSCSSCSSLIQAADCPTPILRAAIDMTWATQANQCAKEQVLCNCNSVFLRLQTVCARISAALPVAGQQLLNDYLSNYRWVTATYMDSINIKLASVPSGQTDSDITAIQSSVDSFREQCEDLASFMEGLATIAEGWAAGAPATNPDTVTELQSDIPIFEAIIKVSEEFAWPLGISIFHRLVYQIMLLLFLADQRLPAETLRSHQPSHQPNWCQYQHCFSLSGGCCEQLIRIYSIETFNMISANV